MLPEPETYAVQDGGLWNNTWNAPDSVMPRPTPRYTFKAGNSDDVVAGLNFAHEKGLKVAARGTGHHCAALSLAQDGVLIDLSGLTAIKVDEEAATAWIQPGVRSGQLYKELSQLSRRLLFPGGHISSVGCTGFTAGGGVGWNNREWGFACDNVLEFKVALPPTDTEAAKVVICSATENPDLFWACRGGARFVGIITETKIKLFPAPESMTTMFVAIPLKDAKAAWALWKTAVDSTPPSCYPMIVLSTPQGGDKSAIVVLYNFAVAEEERKTIDAAIETCLDGLKKLQNCQVLLHGQLPFLDTLSSQDPFGDPPQQAGYNCSAFLDLKKVDDAFLDILIKHFENVSHPRTGIVMAPTAPSPPLAPGVFGDRSNTLWYEILTGWERTDGGAQKDEDARHIAWTDGIFGELYDKKFMDVSYMNNSMMVGRERGTAGGVSPSDCFRPEELEKLKEIKTKYDPKQILARLY